MCCSEVASRQNAQCELGLCSCPNSRRQLTLLDFLSDTEERKDLVGSAEAAAVEVLAETVGENDPASARYQAGLRDDIIRKHRRSIAMAEFTSTCLATYQPPVAFASPGSQGKSNRS